MTGFRLLNNGGLKQAAGRVSRAADLTAANLAVVLASILGLVIISWLRK